MKYIQFIASFIITSTVFAQTPVGVWKNIDDSDGKEKSHIEIYEENGKLYGKVIKLLPAATIVSCKKCKGDKRDAPLLNMVILRDLKQKDDQWTDGKILDPAKGKEYSCLIALEDSNTLKVRGYIGKPLFGRSQYWYRVL